MSVYVENAISISAALAIIKFSSIPKLALWKQRANHLLLIFQRIPALNGTNSSQTSIMLQRDIFPNDILENYCKSQKNWDKGSEKNKTGYNDLFV